MSRRTRIERTNRFATKTLRPAGKPIVEELERRMLLTSVVSSHIPASITAAGKPEQLFAPGASTFALTTTAGLNVVSSQFYRFALDNVQDGQPMTFSLSTAVPSIATHVDTALALYDADGNLLQKVDADSPNPSTESLSATPASGQQYVLGVFTANIGVTQPAERVNLTVNTPPQVINSTLKINPTTGQLQFQANSGQDRFTSPTDVNYFPLDFTNGGASGTVTLQAPSPNSQFSAFLYWQNSSGTWVQTASGSGAPVTLNLSGLGNLSGLPLMLAVSPMNLSSPALPYEVDLSAGSVLGPAMVASPTSTLTPLPVSPGSADVSITQNFNGGPGTFKFQSVDNTPVQIILQTGTATQVLSVYDGTGANLLGVAGSVFTLATTKGEQFIVRAGDSAAVYPGQFTLDVSQSYTPAPLAATNALAQQSGLALLPGTGGQLYRVTPPAGANYLLLKLAADAGATLTPEIDAVAAGLSTVQKIGTAGGAALLAVDLSQVSSPVDALLTGNNGTGTATFSYAALTVPQQVPLGQLTTRALDLKTSGFNAALPAPAFGQVTGVQFYELSPGQSQTFSASASSGTPPLLLRYAQDGGVLRLDGQGLAASGSPTLTANLSGTLIYGIVAMSLDPTSTGTVQFQVSGSATPPLAQGVGVAMAPNDVPVPNQPPPTPPFLSQLELRNQIITRPEQRDLFATLLPFNMTAAPTLTFTPNGGQLAVQITVLDANNSVLNTFTTQPGQAFTSPALSALAPATAAGQTVRLLVEPLAGQPLGDGMYNLEMDVATSDPNPYLLTQTTLQSFQYRFMGDLPFGSSVIGSLPPPPILPGIQGSTIEVFRVHLPNATTPFRIWTQDIDPTVNTDIKIYRNKFIDITDSELTEFDNEPAPSFDYYPADRSTIDAQVVVNNYHILDHEYDDASYGQFDKNNVYVAVLNEQGSKGQYKISAGPVNEPLVGPGVPYQPLSFGGPPTQLFIDPETGIGTIAFNASVSGNQAIVLNTPHGLTNAPITLSATAAGTGEAVQVHIFDAASHPIFQGTATTDSSHVATVSLPQLAPDSGYTLGLVDTGGEPLNNVTLNCGVSTSSAPNQPATTDTLAGGTTEPYVRAVPAPDGSFTDQATGRGISLNRVTLGKVAFYVSAAGPAHFSLSAANVSSPSLALYAEQQQGGEFLDVAGNLLDFASQPGSDGTYSFDAYLTPGIYVLKVVGSLFGPGGHSTSITATTPAYDATRITLDPTTAQNDQANLQTLNLNRPSDPFSNDFDFYGTQFYQLIAPGGVQGPLNLDLHNVVNNSGVFDVGIYKKTASSYTLVGSTTLNLNASPPPMSVTLQTNDMPAPGDQYFIGINRDLAATVTGTSQLSLGPSFQIPQPGLPDLVVQPIQLSPDNGRTRVQVTIRNLAYGAAPSSHGLLALSNYPSPSVLNFSGIGPFGTVSYIADWTPDDPSNTVSFTADYDNQITELSKINNFQSIALSTVDAHAPTVSIALKDPTLNGETGGPWGRYISGIYGLFDDILVSGADSDSNLYQVILNGGPISASITASGPSAANMLDVPIDFGQFPPSSGGNSNLHYSAIDAYGLSTGDQVQQVDVVPDPKFFTSISWDPKKGDYKLIFSRDVVNKEATVNDLLTSFLGYEVPVVGNFDNQFLIHLEADTTAKLDPTNAVALPFTANILLKAVNQTLYNENLVPGINPKDKLTFNSTFDLDPRTLTVVSSSALGLTLTNLKVLHYQTPLLKVFSFGIPDVASVDAGFKFGIDASLSAGVKVGYNPNAANDPLTSTDHTGLMSPTFIAPTISGSATVEGDVSVAGFDVASLSGTVSLGLTVTFGLDNNDPAKVFSFSELDDHLAIALSANLDIKLAAHVAIIGDIWSYDYKHTFPLADSSTEGILTKDPTLPGGGTTPQLQQLLADPLLVLGTAAQLGSAPPPVLQSGSALVGDYPIDPHPQIVIDPATGNALAIQVVNASQTSGVTVGNLSVSQRTNNVWSTPTVLPSGDVSDPVLALSHDNTSSLAAAVVYEADNAPGTPATQTLSQKLAATDIRYRYFNGVSFGPEQSITNDSLADINPSLAFNASGVGVAAWVHNTAAIPIDASGNYSRDTQDIQAAVWNAATHTFSAPISITSPDGVADYNPATFVDDSGRMYVVWIHGADDNNVLMYSTSTGGAWSAPAVLPITGLTPAGSFKELALGRDPQGNINVLFSYRNPLGNIGDAVQSFLLDRPTTPANFAQPTGTEQISQDANFSRLQTTNKPDGSLVAYWQNGDGVDNGVFYSALPSASSPWTAPMPLTSTTDLTMAPSLAVDTNGHMDVLFDQRAPEGGQAGSSPDPQVGVALAPGVGSSNIAQLPELSFSNGLFFSHADALPAGSTALGQAVILNSGTVPAQVTINSYVGTPATGTLVKSQAINLGAGHTYNYSQLFTVAPGLQTYSVQVISATGEAVSTADDISSATLNGLADLSTALTASDPAPKPGEPVTLAAVVSNNTGVNLGAFDVTLYSGDPRFPNLPLGTLATTHIAAGLGAFSSVEADFSVTLPSSAGQFVFTALADSGNVIQEVTKSNNYGQFSVSFTADPTVVSVVPVLNNSSGQNNVTVTVNLANLGNVAVANVPVHLQLSRDGGPFVDAGTQSFSLGAAPATTMLTFQANGLAGDNLFRATLDPSVNAYDSNLSNNSAQAHLIVRGLPDLSVGTITLSNSRPQQGDPLPVNATILNGGIADASNVLVELFAVPQGGSDIALASTRVDLVPALGQANAVLIADTSSLAPGNYTLRVQVNRLQDVLESNTLNDTATVPLTVIAPITPTNVLNGTAGVANTITLRRDPNGTEDDVWINVPATNPPAQVALLSQPITINGGGMTDTLVLDTSNGDPLPVQLILNGVFTTAALSVGAGKLVTLAHTATPNANSLAVSSLAVDPTGKLDVGDGSVRIAYAGNDPVATIQRYLRAGYDGGAWNGAGILTSSGDATHALGLGDWADGVVSGLSANTLLIRWTRLGDVNLDGKVGFADLVAVARNYGKSGQNWDQGDMNYDGAVGFDDLLTVARNYGATAAVQSAPAVLAAAPLEIPIKTRKRR